MRFSQYFTVLLLIMLVLVTFATTTTYMFDQERYNVTVETKYQNAYTNQSELKQFIKDTTSVSLDMEEGTREAKTIEGEFDDQSESWNPAINLAKGSFTAVKNMVYTVATVLEIPPIITGIVIALVIFGMLFATISLIFRWNS